MKFLLVPLEKEIRALKEHTHYDRCTKMSLWVNKITQIVSVSVSN
jgi:hypothetical protein